MISKIKITTFGLQVWYSILELLFPSSCLHCFCSIEPGGILCELCLWSLVPEESELSLGTEFQGIGSLIAVFPYDGPAGSLVRGLKLRSSPYIAEGMGGYMAHQFLKFDLPLPDIIVPVPLSASHHFSRGYNQSLLLAYEMGKILDRPVLELLGKYSIAYSQMNLSTEDRKNLNKDLFTVRGAIDRSKRILLVDDVVTTGSTLRCSAQQLAVFEPSSIDAIAFAKA